MFTLWQGASTFSSPITSHMIAHFAYKKVRKLNLVLLYFELDSLGDPIVTLSRHTEPGVEPERSAGYLSAIRDK